MLNFIPLAAALLLGGPSMPNFETSVETQVMSAPVVASSRMSAETERMLIEKWAAPHWKLSPSTAWDLYFSKSLKITELATNTLYRISYNDGILDVFVDPSGI